MLWIALHLPHLPLQALRWSQPGLEAALPLAVAEAAGHQHRLLAVNRAATALGAEAGQSAATALSLAPQLLVLARDAAQEAAFVHTLALALGALTPNLSQTLNPIASGVLLEVSASLRLFGGVRPLLRAAQVLARRCGAQARLACAPTASAAWLLATSGVQQRRCLQAVRCARLLDRVPAAALSALLPLTVGQRDLLHLLGMQRLHTLRALPRGGLQRRLGSALALALDRAYGQAPDPRPWLVVPEHFEAQRELLQRADEAQVLVAAVDALLPALHGWLQLRWRAATVLSLRLRHEHGRVPVPDTVLRLQLSDPSRDLAQLALLWRERLQRHALAAPVYALALALDASVPHGGTPGELLPMGAAAGTHAALLDRLVARLGADRVQRWEPVADHRPERAQRPVCATEPAGSAREAKATAAAASMLQSTPATLTASRGPVAASPAAPTLAPLSASPPVLSPTSSPTDLLRPAWLLARPEPLAADALGRPLHGGGALRLCSRPERIETGWFDDAPARRDYHVAEAPDHRWCWIYKEHRAATAHDASGDAGWFLHGWFG